MNCEYDLSKLTGESGRPAEENFFYDLFIEDYNKVLIDIPVLVSNLRDSNGGRPNEDVDYENAGSWTLVRRFFLFDTISGIENYDANKFGKYQKT
jgi:hypothetical protein